MIGIPVMTSEFIIGRKSRRNVFGAFRKLAPGSYWYLIGLMGVVAAFMILAFYTAVAGWTLEYTYQSVVNGFEKLSSHELSGMYESFIGSPWKPLFWFFVFMLLTSLIIIAGVQRGIEKYSKILMPFLFVLLLILVVRSITLPGAKGELCFFLNPTSAK